MGGQAFLLQLQPFLNADNVRVVAVCDVDPLCARKTAKKKSTSTIMTSACPGLPRTWREVLDRDDVDAIMNSTSDQWHVPISLGRRTPRQARKAARSLSHSAWPEGRRVSGRCRQASGRNLPAPTANAVRNAHMIKLAELARNGYLGSLRAHRGLRGPRDDTAGGDPDTRARTGRIELRHVGRPGAFPIPTASTAYSRLRPTRDPAGCAVSIPARA
jgi:hypothetical protein